MRSRQLVLGVITSLVVVAAAVALLLVVDSPSGSDLELPDRVGDRVALDTPAAYPDGEEPSEGTLERQRARAAVNSDGWSDAFGGAAAATRVYSDDDGNLDELISVVAVAGDTGPLLPAEGFLDPEELGLALPRTERVTDGEVECLLTRNDPPRAGTDYQPEQATPDSHECQRRSDSLTVRVTWRTGDTDAVTRFVDDLWDELG